MSRYFFERLPDAYQEVIEEAARSLIVQEGEWYSANDIRFLESLKTEGAEVTLPDREPFREASKRVYQAWADRIGGMGLIDKILDFDYQSKN